MNVVWNLDKLVIQSYTRPVMYKPKYNTFSSLHLHNYRTDLLGYILVTIRYLSESHSYNLHSLRRSHDKNDMVLSLSVTGFDKATTLFTA